MSYIQTANSSVQLCNICSEVIAKTTNICLATKWHGLCLHNESLRFQLTITPEYDGSKLIIPVDVDIGTTDSRSQQDEKSGDAVSSSTIETDCSIYSHSL